MNTQKLTRMLPPKFLDLAKQASLTHIAVGLGGLVVLVALLGGGAATNSHDVAASQQALFDAVETQRRSVAEAGVRAALDEINRVVDLVRSVGEQREAWDNEVLPLRHNAEGRSIAGNDELVRQFAAILDLDLGPADTAKTQMARLDALKKPLEDVLRGKAAAFEPDEKLHDMVNHELELAQEMLLRLRDARAMADALARKAKTSGSKSTSITLAEAVERHRAGLADKRIAAIVAAREEAEVQTREALAATEKRKTLELGEAQRKRREAELEAERAKAEQEAEATKRKARYDELLAQANDPIIQKRYAVFLQKGSFSFRTGRREKGAHFRASYSALQQRKILSDLKWFEAAVFGDAKNWSYTFRMEFGQNDRPLWAGRPTTDEQWQEFRELAQEFVRLAPIWRDMGLLSP